MLIKCYKKKINLFGVLEQKGVLRLKVLNKAAG
jgi:hypothetical protein